MCIKLILQHIYYSQYSKWKNVNPSGMENSTFRKYWFIDGHRIVDVVNVKGLLVAKVKRKRKELTSCESEVNVTVALRGNMFNVSHVQWYVTEDLINYGRKWYLYIYI